jgi:membrane-bound lytic murein transglycosylase D
MRSRVRTTFTGHVVRRGDSLSRIATQYGVPVQGIVELNGIKNGRRLKPGTELLIPRPLRGGVETVSARTQPQVEEAPRAEAPRAEAPRAEAPRAEVARERPAREAPARVQPRTQARVDRKVFRVRHGDTLWSISQRYGVEVDDLCRWNRIKSPGHYKLVAGKRLVVYPDRG